MRGLAIGGFGNTFAADYAGIMIDGSSGVRIEGNSLGLRARRIDGQPEHRRRVHQRLVEHHDRRDDGRRAQRHLGQQELGLQHPGRRRQRHRGEPDRPGRERPDPPRQGRRRALANGTTNNTVGGSTAAARNILSGNSSRGLRIFNAGTSGNLVAGNWIGPDAAGGLLNGLQAIAGVQISDGATGNTIGGPGGLGNVISGNAITGILLDAASNTVQGNTIGLAPDGTVLANSNGIYVNAASNQIGGSAAGAGNTISGNTNLGVFLPTTATGTRVQGNLIGLAPDGSTVRGNGWGVVVTNSSRNWIGTDGDGLGDATEGNVISGNNGGGIKIEGASTWNVVAGNLIGTDAAGTAARGNLAMGIWLVSGASYNRIGTDGDGVSDSLERNVIAGSTTYGIEIGDTTTIGNVVAGNYIGTDKDGLNALPNGNHGVLVRRGSSGNRIGTDGNNVSDDLERNLISGNTGWGVVIADANSNRNVVAGNDVGTKANGLSALPNAGGGVYVGGTVTGNRVGADIETGIASSALSYTAGATGQAVQFGTGGFIDIPAAPSLDLQRFTLSAKVLASGPGPNNDAYGSVILGKNLPQPAGNSSVSLQLSWRATDNRFLFIFGNVSTESIASTSTFAPGTLHSVAATYDGATFKLYVDGTLEGQRALTKTITYNPTIPWTIGSTSDVYRASGFARTWNGAIDDVRIHNRALNPSEIAALAGPGDGVLAGQIRHYGMEGEVANDMLSGLPAQRNVVSGNTLDGIKLEGGVTQSLVAGNLIGLGADGSTVVGNAGHGIVSLNSSNNTIGGASVLAQQHRLGQPAARHRSLHRLHVEPRPEQLRGDGRDRHAR